MARKRYSDEDIFELRSEVELNLASGGDMVTAYRVDEYTRQAPCVTVRIKMCSADALEALYPILLKRGKPDDIRSDNAPEFIAPPLQERLTRAGIEPMQI